VWYGDALTRPERNLMERAAVLAKGHLFFRAAVDVVEHEGREAPPGHPAQVGDVHDAGGADGTGETTVRLHGVAGIWVLIDRVGADRITRDARFLDSRAARPRIGRRRMLKELDMTRRLIGSIGMCAAVAGAVALMSVP